jgi:hypothetical protein
LNIASISNVFQIKRGEFNNPNGFEQHYYVEKPHVLVEEECCVEEAPHVVDIIQLTLEPL